MTKTPIASQAQRALADTLADSAAHEEDPIAVILIVVDAKGICHFNAGYDQNDPDLHEYLRGVLDTCAKQLGDGSGITMDYKDSA